jgi:hypothetical protein
MFCNFIFQTTLPEFQKTEFFVVRQHEEFVWLHDRFEENEEYAGYIVCDFKYKTLLYNICKDLNKICIFVLEINLYFIL